MNRKRESLFPYGAARKKRGVGWCSLLAPGDLRENKSDAGEVFRLLTEGLKTSSRNVSL